MLDTIQPDDRKHFDDGFAAGNALGRSLRVLPTFAAALGKAEEPKPRDVGEAVVDPNRAAQDRVIASSGKLTPEEQAKRANGNGLKTWDLVLQNARDARFPKGTDVFLTKFQGLFYVAPAQNAFMCRLRLAGGALTSHQLRGIAALAEQFGGGYADVTTRANLQIRQIAPQHAADLLMGLHELGIINRGAGADNIRNVTCSPTAGFDPQELIDTLPLARQMHHYILNHPEMYGLPRKFNIAFDGGGAISALEDTNDIGFTAVRVSEGKSVASGIYFRLTLGGITGHRDFARDTGILLTPDECVPVAAAVVRAFVEHGDRTDRKKARLKYVLDRMGFEPFLMEVEKHLGHKLRRVAIDECDVRPQVSKHGPIGVFAQRQSGFSYVGVALPVGRLRVDQMRGLADIADRHGTGTLRLTVWQNVLLPHVPDDRLADVKRDLESIGLGCSASSVRAGLVACTGSAGCKYAAADTKADAMRLTEYLESRLALDAPVNIHITGCPHSCAQHYIGDIGLLATKVAAGDDTVDGYHVFVGGGYGAERNIARELVRDVPATELPQRIERLLHTYLQRRASAQETFREFVCRCPTTDLISALAC